MKKTDDPGYGFTPSTIDRMKDGLKKILNIHETNAKIEQQRQQEIEQARAAEIAQAQAAEQWLKENAEVEAEAALLAPLPVTEEVIESFSTHPHLFIKVITPKMEETKIGNDTWWVQQGTTITYRRRTAEHEGLDEIREPAPPTPDHLILKPKPANREREFGIHGDWKAGVHPHLLAGLASSDPAQVDHNDSMSFGRWMRGGFAR